MNSDFGISQFRHLIKWAVLMVVFIVLGLFISFYFALVVSLAAVAVFVDMQGHLLYVIALVLLVIAAVVTALSYQSFANWLASIAFYALAIGVALDLYHYVHSGSETNSIHPYDWK